MLGPLRKRIAATLLAAATVACSQIAGLEDPQAAPLPEGPGGAPSEPTDGEPPATVEVSPRELDFGLVACGAAPAGPEVITLLNKGDAPAPYTVQLPEGTPFTLKGETSGTLAPGASVPISVFAATTSSAPLTGSVLVTAAGAVTEVTAKVADKGASLELLPTLADFGEVRFQVGGTPIPIQIRNVGTDPVTIPSFEGTTADFAVDWAGKPAALVIPAGGSATVQATFSSGATVSAAILEAKLRPVVDGVLCGDRPTLTSRGKRIDTTVTISVADWGSVDCNTADPGQRTITIQNFFTGQVGYQVALGGGSAFELVSPAQGTVNAGQSAEVTLAAKATGTSLGTIEEDVDVTISGVAAPSGGPRKTKARIRVRGAIVGVTPASITSYRYIYNDTDWKAFAVGNTGNESVSVTYRVIRQDSNGGTAWTWYTNTISLSPGQQKNMWVGFRPTNRGTFPADVPVSRYGGAKVCETLPVGKARGER